MQPPVRRNARVRKQAYSKHAYMRPRECTGSRCMYVYVRYVRISLNRFTSFRFPTFRGVTSNVTLALRAVDNRSQTSKKLRVLYDGI